MTLIILLALTLSKGAPPILLKKISDLSAIAHRSCLHLLPEQTSDSPFGAALLCGEKLTSDKFRNPLLRASLLHLFVVSGAHLVFLDEFMLALGIPFLVRFSFTLLYAVACAWQAPVVRALFQLLARQSFGARFPTDWRILWGGLAVLLCFPDWIQSHSLLMGWAASLALAAVTVLTETRGARRLLLQAMAVYFVMLPLLWGWGNLHPLGIVFNLLVAPFVMALLLPLFAATALFPSLSAVADSFGQTLLRILSLFTEPIRMETGVGPSLPCLWAGLLALHLLIHFGRVRRRRAML